MKIALAQIRPFVGDIHGNTRRIIEYSRNAAEAGAELVLFPELAITGYPPRDLLLRDEFVAANLDALTELLPVSKEIGIITGAVGRNPGPGRPLHNMSVFLADGEVRAIYRKRLLPTYDVFDETRYFTRGDGPVTAEFRGKKLGLVICEDVWNVPAVTGNEEYAINPVTESVEAGADVICGISASPFAIGKIEIRTRLAEYHAGKHGIPFLLASSCGAVDEILFDGTSLAAAPDGSIAAVGKMFAEDLVVYDTDSPGRAELPVTDEIKNVHDALIMGIREYSLACGIGKAIVAISGGIDSALVCSLAVLALGKENVLGVAMPGPYSSDMSLEDAKGLAENLGCEFQVAGISDYFEKIRTDLRPLGVRENTLAEENLQARLRGTILMTLSNARGAVVLAPGNKSEIATGYSTLYGDTVGALAPIGDIFKTMVFKLAGYVNRNGTIIPERTLTRKPSAELALGQVDEDVLPEYEPLDDILKLFLDEHKSPAEITAAGFDGETVDKVVEMVKKAEYKRHQLPPTLKVTWRAFGTGRRMPLNHGWH